MRRRLELPRHDLGALASLPSSTAASADKSASQAWRARAHCSETAAANASPHYSIRSDIATDGRSAKAASAVSGRTYLDHCANRPSKVGDNSDATSVSAASQCRVEFRLLVAFPLGDEGPLASFALRRFAWICRSVAIVSLRSLVLRCASRARHHRRYPFCRLFDG